MEGERFRTVCGTEIISYDSKCHPSVSQHPSYFSVFLISVPVLPSEVFSFSFPLISNLFSLSLLLSQHTTPLYLHLSTAKTPHRSLFLKSPSSMFLFNLIKSLPGPPSPCPISLLPSETQNTFCNILKHSNHLRGP